MKEIPPYYQLLLELYLQDQCTPDQAEELFNYLQKDESNRMLLKQLRKDQHYLVQEESGLGEEADARIRARLLQHITPVRIPLHRRWYTRAAAAAAVILAGTALLTWYRSSGSAESGPSAQNPPALSRPVVPGGNKAYLQLADGSVIVLDTARNGTIRRQQQVQIIKAEDGQLTYDLRGPEAGSGGLNTISTPRGGQYKVVLSDGTAVWLNAASSLQFPVVFAGPERKVALTGEGYFEVAPNKAKPFRVAINNVEVQVLGTTFNVKGYSDEGVTATTLVEGSVRIQSKERSATISPGEQASVPAGRDHITLSKPDVEGVVAWKNGYFMFSNENIQSIMRQVARWYDVEVAYEGSVTDKNFSGTISRFGQVSEVLHMLELTGVVHFKTEGRKITVIP